MAVAVGTSDDGHRLSDVTTRLPTIARVTASSCGRLVKRSGRVVVWCGRMIAPGGRRRVDRNDGLARWTRWTDACRRRSAIGTASAGGAQPIWRYRGIGPYPAYDRSRGVRTLEDCSPGLPGLLACGSSSTCLSGLHLRPEIEAGSSPCRSTSNCRTPGREMEALGEPSPSWWTTESGGPRHDLREDRARSGRSILSTTSRVGDLCRGRQHIEQSRSSRGVSSSRCSPPREEGLLQDRDFFDAVVRSAARGGCITACELSTRGVAGGQELGSSAVAVESSDGIPAQD